MAIQQPAASDFLNSPDHSLSHRVFANDNLSPVESIVVDSAGYVGIGTAAPSQQLDIKGTGTSEITMQNNWYLSTGAWINLSVDGPSGIGSGGAGVDPWIAYAKTAGHWFTNSVAGDIAYRNTAGKLLFGTSAGDSSMAIQGNNVGIGISTPFVTLQLQKNSTLTATIQEMQRIVLTSTGTVAANFGASHKTYLEDASGNTAQIASSIATIWATATHGSESSAITLSGVTSGGAITEWARIMGGNVGIGTTTPTNLLSLGGNSARIFWMQRHTTANTDGNTLTVTAGGATTGATDKAGGNLILQGGLSTGSGESGVIIQGCVAGASGTTDRTQTTMIQSLGNKIGFYSATPVAKQTGVAVTAEAIHAALVSLGLIAA